jgi:hypothetical protein
MLRALWPSALTGDVEAVDGTLRSGLMSRGETARSRALIEQAPLPKGDASEPVSRYLAEQTWRRARR